MGNRSSSSASLVYVQGIVRALIIISLALTSFNGSYISSANAAADGGNTKLPTNAEEAIDSLKVLDAVVNYKEIADLKNYNDTRIAEYGLWRLDTELRTGTDKVLLETLSVLLTELLNKPEFNKSVFFQNESDIMKMRDVFEQKYPQKNLVFRPHFEQFIRRYGNIKTYSDVDGKKSTTRFKTSLGSSILTPDNGTFQTPEQELEKFKSELEKRIIDQPEVIKAFYDLEFEALIKGGVLSEPPFFYLMGLPGVGKDTSAEAYVNAKFGPQGEKHLFHVNVQKDKQDANVLLGSGTGFIGSEKMSPLVRFLVLHAAGRYEIRDTDAEGRAVAPFPAENPSWKPGMVMDGYFENGVIFLNEFHNWSAEAKSTLFKEALEKGVFKVNNPGDGGVDKLIVPGIRFIAASNEGIDLYTNRDIDGSRIGEPLTYEEMIERYEKVAHNKDLLKQTIAKTASKNAPGTNRDSKVGTPEEILNRIHPSRMILMKPISPTGMKKIIRMRIESINEQLSNAEYGSYGRFRIQATDALVDFIQTYDFNAEDGARPAKDRVRSIMEYTFYQALKDTKATAVDLRSGITLDIKRNEDKTYSLVVLKGLGKTLLLKEQVIQETLKERDVTPITDNKIDNLLTLEQRLKGKIFGAEKAIEQVSKAMLLSEEARFVKNKKWSEHEKATSFAFLGPSSTGKSEMVKALVSELYPGTGDQRRVDIDGNQIKGQHHMEEFFWGRKEGREVVPSRFMQMYDQYNGNMILVIEESSNIPKELLKSLYDMFREAHPKFADGKDRPMTNVTIILTGNAGIEWYSGVPRDLPEEVRMAAWQRIYKEAMKEPGRSRITLEKYYPEPLINRIGEQNIIWFSPLSFKAVRELTALKTNIYLSKLGAANGRRGWDVGFKTQSDYERVLEVFEKEGFLLEEQGASIDRYVDMAINKDLRALLLANKVDTGAKVALSPRVDQSEEVIKKNGKVLIDVIVEGRKERLTLSLHAKKREAFPKDSIADMIQTAIHEAGHEFVGRLLLGDKHKSDFITVIKGVTEINGEWVYYAGLRSSEEVERLVYTKEAVERAIAGLLAGEVAQTIFSKGQRHDAGKHNDIERATQIARRAVGEWGLSPVWGNRSMSKQSIETMSDADRNLFNAEVNKFLNRSRNLAYNTILKNRAVFSELASDLIEKGEIKSEGLEEFYSKNNSKIVEINDQERDSTKVDAKLLPPGYNDPSYRKTHNVEVADFFTVPKTIANIDDIVANEKKAEIALAKMPEKLPIFSGFSDANPAPVLVLAPNRVEKQVKPEVREEIPKSKALTVIPKQKEVSRRGPNNVPRGGTCSSLFR